MPIRIGPFVRPCRSLTLIIIGCAWASGSAVAQAGTNAAPEGQESPQLSAALATEMDQRMQLSGEIVRHVEADAKARGATEAWRIGLLSLMYNTPSASLRDIAAATTTLDQAQTMVQAALPKPASAALAKNLGSSSSSLVFTPLTPCRFIDTRNVGGVLINVPRQFNATAAGPAYGGAVGCQLPSAAVAIAANVTVTVAAGGPGFVTLRPAASNEVTSFLNWPIGGTSGVANAGIIPLSFNGLFEAYAIGNTPQLIVDVFGYFSAAADRDRSLACYQIRNPITIPGFSNNYYYSTACASGYQAVSAYCWNQNVTGVWMSASGVGIDGVTAFCGFINNSSPSANVTTGVQCCKVPAVF